MAYDKIQYVWRCRVWGLIAIIAGCVALVSGAFWLKETYFPVTEAPKEKVCTKMVAVICESTISRRDKCTEWDLAKYQVIKPSAFGSSSHNYRIKNLTDPTEQYTLSHWNVTSVTEICKEYGYANR